MDIRTAEIMLKFGWDMTRKAWNNTKYVKKASCSPIFDLVTVSDGKMKQYKASDEDWYAKDWELYSNQKMPLPTLT